MPSLVYEKKLFRLGYKLIAGIDEAGRGPLAGPVVAAAVILPIDFKLQGLDDSKKISSQKREKLFLKISEGAVDIGIGIVDHGKIDEINIGQASLLAMKMAVDQLMLEPDYLLVDGKHYKVKLNISQRSIVGGDGKCSSIAAASIIAKVTRDKLMVDYHKKYPLYGFNKHKGYGTKGGF